MANITLKRASVGIILAFIFYIFSTNYRLTISNVKLIYKPIFYHGQEVNRNFFEGWYYKTVTSKAEESLIIIPGIYKSTSPNDEESHAFVMVFRDGYECLYYRYNINEFNVENGDSNRFTIKIGQSKFSENDIVLSLPSTRLVLSTDIEYESFTDLVVKDWIRILRKGSESDFSSLKSSIIKHPFIPYSVRGYISFNNTTPYPFTYFSPTVMGPFAYIPFLECNHGIVSMSHKSSGMIEFVNMKYNGIVESRIDLGNGFGYIEKDWGVNFPKSWIWFHSNTFINEMEEEKTSSIMVSIADFPLISEDNPLYNIPYLDKLLSLFHLPGRIIVFYHAKSDIIYNFSTYNIFSKVVDLKVTMNDFAMQYVKLHVVNTVNGLNLEINIKHKAGNGVPLRAPSKEFGKMVLLVEEGLNAELHVKLWKSDEDSKEEVIFNDRAVGSLEIVGDVMRLVNKLSDR